MHAANISAQSVSQASALGDLGSGGGRGWSRRILIGLAADEELLGNPPHRLARGSSEFGVLELTRPAVARDLLAEVLAVGEVQAAALVQGAEVPAAWAVLPHVDVVEAVARVLAQVHVAVARLGGRGRWPGAGAHGRGRVASGVHGAFLVAAVGTPLQTGPGAVDAVAIHRGFNRQLWLKPWALRRYVVAQVGHAGVNAASIGDHASGRAVLSSLLPFQTSVDAIDAAAVPHTACGSGASKSKDGASDGRLQHLDVAAEDFS